MLDPAVDALPAEEVLEHLIAAPGRALRGERGGLAARRRLPPRHPAWRSRVAGRGRAARARRPGRARHGRHARARVRGRRPAPPDERLVYELVAARIGRSVARLRHEREAAVAEAGLRAENRAAGRLYRVSTALMAERELKDVVQRVTEESTALAGAQFGAFFYNVLDSRGESYMLYTIAGVPREAFERFPMPRNTEVFDPTFRGEGSCAATTSWRIPATGTAPPTTGCRRATCRCARTSPCPSGRATARCSAGSSSATSGRRCSTMTRSGSWSRCRRSRRSRSRTPACTTPRGASSTRASAPTSSATTSPACCRRACCRRGCPRSPGSSSPPATSPARAWSAATSTTSSRSATRRSGSRSATSRARTRARPA